MTHGRWLATVATALTATALIATACGGGGDDDDDGDANGGAGCTPVAAAEAEVDQDNLKFEPSELCVREGQEILFRNSESAIHTVTIDGEDESGTMREGDEFRWTPPSAGTFDITCDFHPQMKARVEVVGETQ
jgi:plastocyanin